MKRAVSRKNPRVKRSKVMRGNVTEADKRAYRLAKTALSGIRTESDFILAAVHALVAAHAKGQALQLPIRFLTEAQRDFIVKSGREDLL